LVGWPALASAQRPDTGRAGATFVPLAQPDTGPPVGPRLPMATVIARTLAHSPVYDTASGTVRTSRSFERVALGQFLPTVTASALAARSDQTFGSVTTATPSGPRGAYGGGLLATLPLFTGGFRGAVRREAAALARAANAGLVLNRFATRFTAKQGYYAVLYAHELVRVGHDAVTVYSKGLSYAKTQRAAGTVTPVDVFQAQLALTQAQYQLLAALDTLTSNAAELGRLVGSDGPVDAEPLDNLDPTPLAMDDSAIVQAALRDAPAVQQTEAQVAATQASVRAAKAQ
jgi:outer membrane protein